MKKILINNTSILSGDKILKNKNVLIEDGYLKILDFTEKDKDLIFINGEGKIVLPSFTIFKDTIFDVLSYKYLHEFKEDFKLNREIFKIFPFDILEKSLEIIARRIALNGHSVFFYSHLSYQMVKNSLLTIAKTLERDYSIRSSVSYFYNDKLPEQIILSKKENKDFSDYASNIRSNFKIHHNAYYFPNNFESIEYKKVNHFYFEKEVNKDLYTEILDRLPDDSICFVEFENLDAILSFEPKFNTYMLINGDYFFNKEFSDEFFKKIDNNPDLNFFIINGYNSYNIFSTFYQIFKATKNYGIIKLIKNQIVNLQKIPEYLFSEKIGKIEDNYSADLILIDLQNFPVEDFNQFIDFAILYYLERPFPDLIIYDGKIILKKV